VAEPVEDSTFVSLSPHDVKPQSDPMQLLPGRQSFLLRRARGDMEESAMGGVVGRSRQCRVVGRLTRHPVACSTRVTSVDRDQCIRRTRTYWLKCSHQSNPLDRTALPQRPIPFRPCEQTGRVGFHSETSHHTVRNPHAASHDDNQAFWIDEQATLPP